MWMAALSMAMCTAAHLIDGQPDESEVVDGSEAGLEEERLPGQEPLQFHVRVPHLGVVWYAIHAIIWYGMVFWSIL